MINSWTPVFWRFNFASFVRVYNNNFLHRCCYFGRRALNSSRHILVRKVIEKIGVELQRRRIAIDSSGATKFQLGQVRNYPRRVVGVLVMGGGILHPLHEHLENNHRLEHERSRD